MNDLLLRYATSKVWCNPGQDRQGVFELARLTPNGGRRHSFSVQYERMSLPDSTSDWMVYQIGKIIPSLHNFPPRKWHWNRMDELARERLLFTELYTKDGIHFPRFESYMMLGHGDNLLVAVKINDKIAKLNEETLYARLYSNAYFSSVRSDGRRRLDIQGKRFSSQSDVLPFQRDVEREAQEFGGHVLYYVNGRMVHNLSLTTVKEGDVGEAVFDASIERVVDIPIKDMGVFTSTKDQLRKYLVHYYDDTVKRIDYQDDIDVYLIKKVNDRFHGIYYHRNDPVWMRMVTHKDYSVPVPRINAFIETKTSKTDKVDPKQPEVTWQRGDDITLRLYIRNAGYDRPLEPNANRTDLLYRLPAPMVRRAMLGLDATVPFWQADALESSPYVKFMSLPSSSVYPAYFGEEGQTSEEKSKVIALAGEVFGYHAAGKILANSPQPVESKLGVRAATLGLEHWKDSSVFEYDADGYLLGHYYHTLGEYYLPWHEQTTKIETISGMGGDTLAQQYGGEYYDIPKGCNFRLYLGSVWRGESSNDWVDITDSPDLAKYGRLEYQPKGIKRWIWTLDSRNQTGLVRTDKKFIARDIRLTIEDGLLEFSVNATENIGGVEKNRVMELPLGILDVWLNGRALQPGIDYVVKWPQVIISNLRYLNFNDPDQKVTYRLYGFPTTELKLHKTNETGFIRHGVMSENHVFNVHQNKVLRITADGRYLTPEEVVFDEDNSPRQIDKVRNGAPYSVQTPHLVFHEIFEDDLKSRRDDDERERLASAYLTKNLPEKVYPEKDFIPNKYPVISCFANKLLFDLMHNINVPEGIKDHYSEQDIRTWLKDYAWIAEYDLSNVGVNEEYVDIRPHWFDHVVELDYFKYIFFARAVGVFLAKRPDIANYVRMP